MSKISKVVVGWIVINLLFIIPIVFMLVQRLPQRVYVELTTEEPCSVRLGHFNPKEGGGTFHAEYLRECPASRENTVIHYNVASNFSQEGFGIDVGEKVDAVEIHACAIDAYVFLRTWYSVEKEDWGFVCRKSRTRLFIPQPMRIGICVFELIVFIGCCLGLLLLRPSDTDKERIINSTLVGIFVGIFFAIVLPYQSFSVNRSIYPFSFIEFILQSGMIMLALSLLVAVGLYLLYSTLEFFPHCMILAFLFYEYLRTGVLSIGEPPIDGRVDFYYNAHLAVQDIVILIVVHLLPLIFYKKIKGHLKWIVMAAFVMVLASLLDLRRESGTTKSIKDDVGELCRKIEVVDAVKYSSKRNVIVLFLDSISIDSSQDALAKFPEIMDSCYGFTAFTNNVGVHERTTTAVPTIMTAEFYSKGLSNSDGMSKHLARIYSNDAFPYTYKESGNHLYLLPGASYYGYVWPRENRKKNNMTDGEEVSRFVYFHQPEMIPSLSLYDAVRFRMMPFFLKAKVLLATFIATSANSNMWREDTLYAELAKAPIMNSTGMNFILMHTYGAHLPYDVDADGNKCVAALNSYEAYVGKTSFALRQLSEFLKELQRRGIYDKSFIVVASDHGGTGRHPQASEADLPARASAFLWVKPIAADGEMCFSNESTTHLNIKKLVEAAKEKDLTADDVRYLLHSEKRVFRYILDNSYKEWSVDAEGKAKYVAEVQDK